MVARGWGSTGEHRCLIWSAGPHSSQLGYLEEQFILRFYSILFLENAHGNYGFLGRHFHLGPWRIFPFATWGLAKTGKTFFWEHSPPLSPGHLPLYCMIPLPFSTYQLLIGYASHLELLKYSPLSNFSTVKPNIDFSLMDWILLLFFPILLKDDRQMKFLYLVWTIWIFKLWHRMGWNIQNREVINKFNLINISIATCRYIVTDSVCVCVCVCVLGTVRIYSLGIFQVYDKVLLTTDTMIALIEKVPRTYSSYEWNFVLFN